jgi:hypothetical protein
MSRVVGKRRPPVMTVSASTRAGDCIARVATLLAGDLRVRVVPGISRVRGEFGELPVLDALRRYLRKHTSASLIGCEDLPQVARVAPA